MCRITLKQEQLRASLDAPQTHIPKGKYKRYLSWRAKLDVFVHANMSVVEGNYPRCLRYLTSWGLNDTAIYTWVYIFIMMRGRE